MTRCDERSPRHAWGPAGWAVAVVLGGLWWWAAIRVFLQPGPGGFVEGLVAGGGWGLSLLPVRCVPRKRPGAGEGTASPARRRRRRHRAPRG